MSFIKREIDKLNSAIVAEPEGDRRGQLYAAQQALAWALEPNGVRSPFSMIKDIPGVPEGCLDDPHPVPFLDIHDLVRTSR